MFKMFKRDQTLVEIFKEDLALMGDNGHRHDNDWDDKVTVLNKLVRDEARAKTLGILEGAGAVAVGYIIGMVVLNKRTK